MIDCYSEENHGPHQYFELGDFELENGITLPGARIAYKTHGTLNEAKDNVILFPQMWSGTSKSMEIFIGEDRPLDPCKYFIVLPGQFANGFSSSPSNTPPPFNGGAFRPSQHVAQHRHLRHLDRPDHPLPDVRAAAVDLDHVGVLPADFKPPSELFSPTKLLPAGTSLTAGSAAGEASTSPKGSS